MLKKIQKLASPLTSQLANNNLLNNMLNEKLQPQAQKAYVLLLMDVIARGLVSASHNDAEFQKEVQGFAVGTTIQMLVMPNVAQFTLEVLENGRFKIIKQLDKKADLIIKFKHVSLAFLVFSFQESTTESFARDRMVADGDIVDAVRMVRCLNRLEVIILPKLIAQLAVKQYPTDLSIKEKLTVATKVYAGVAKSFIA